MNNLKRRFSCVEAGDGADSPESSPESVKSVSVIDKIGDEFGNSAREEKQDSTAAGLFRLGLLPQKLLNVIFRKLPFLDFLRMQLVSRRFRDICLANPPSTASLDYRVFAIHPTGHEFRHEIDYTRFMNEFIGKYGSHITKFEISAPPDCESYISCINVQKMNSLEMDRNESHELVCSNTLTFLNLRNVEIISEDLIATIGVCFPNLTDLEFCSKCHFHLRLLAYFPKLKRLHSKLCLWQWFNPYGLCTDYVMNAAKIIFFKMEKIAELETSLPMLCKLFESFEDHEVPDVKAIAFSTESRIRMYAEGIHEQLDLMKYLKKFPCVTSVNLGYVYTIEQCWKFFEHIPATVTALLLSKCKLCFEPVRPIETLGRFENLEILQISGNNFPDDDDFSFLSAFPRLKSLRFVATIKHSNRLIPTEFLQIKSFPDRALVDHLPTSANLSEADFEDTGVALNDIAKNLVWRNVRLRRLRLFNLPAFSGPDRNMWRSRLLTVGEVAAKTASHWTALDMEPVKQLINLSGGSLESLSLVGHLKIDDSFLEFISASTVDRLEILDLSKCAVTNEGVDRFLIDRRVKVEAGLAMPLLHLRCSIKSMKKRRLDMANGSKTVIDEIVDPDRVFKYRF